MRLHALAWDEVPPGAVLEEPGREDDGFAPQGGQPCEQLGGGQRREVLDGQPVREGLGLDAQAGLGQAVPSGSAGDDPEPAGLRMPLHRLGDGADEIELQRDADDVGGKRFELAQGGAPDRREDERNSGEEIVPVFQQEVQRLLPRGDENGRRPLGVLVAQVGPHGRKMLGAIEARHVEELVEDLDPRSRIRRERLTKPPIEIDVRRQQPAVRIEHQDGARSSWRCRRGRRRRGYRRDRRDRQAGQ